jgi:hypothetical protein
MRGSLRASRFRYTMPDFPRLLLDASIAMGTPLAVAQLLQVQPKLVYRWMAELERPTEAHVDASRPRLERLLYATQAPSQPHPRRRASDARPPLVR